MYQVTVVHHAVEEEEGENWKVTGTVQDDLVAPAAAPP